MDDYIRLLKKGRDELPDSVKTSERFEIPKVKGHLQGNKTIISNFLQIAGVLGREESHLLKFVLKELATPGEIKGTGILILGRKINSVTINEKIQKYANEYVICPECKKPDTKLLKEDKILFIRCMACGAKKPVKGKL